MPSFPAALTEKYRSFKTGRFSNEAARYKDLGDHGQTPEVMVISCADSRVDPEAIFSAGPGELFVIRNVANLVPPRAHAEHGQSVLSAVEYAVLNLKVKHLVVMGHSGCGGIKAATDQQAAVQSEDNYISGWLRLAADIAKKVQDEMGGGSDKAVTDKLELASIQQSLENLRAYPFVKAREDAGDLALHGCHFRISSGELSVLDEQSGAFQPI